MADAIESFKTAMQSYSLNPPDTLQPRKFHRFPGLDKKRGDDTGLATVSAAHAVAMVHSNG